MIQEGPEEGGFQNFHRQLRRRLADLLLCKLQEQAKSVAIARDGIGTCLSLMHQAIVKKACRSSENWRQVFIAQPPFSFDRDGATPSA